MAGGCSDLEMTWLLYCTGAATVNHIATSEQYCVLYLGEWVCQAHSWTDGNKNYTAYTDGTHDYTDYAYWWYIARKKSPMMARYEHVELIASSATETSLIVRHYFPTSCDSELPVDLWVHVQ